ncbi:MAG: quinoprotein dehydrogenase-associated SoxYZ-like carrier [Methylobacter sp.]|nr:quinoprotein dehydrogenase-associated SoxYZ-like carrier [Methylobacter sp.]MDP2100181.1 quinoprotein dehydrogenase-associated SoxYZ-like carrier [Methylobacter sp.]MDP2426922.1 quinoprotein dehydrogenase-associated SoxYZ-like carrier [Methylobacter sp.]MDP3053640.1 quinoprotein dehydrogenase-associated SoxYZ-like carrier [Methylobacter sp.]MDP3360789.1 quinoprotein dehydrogenase-associated SoxYZ-like carrier [Methylobacter sp.]
MKYPKLLPAIFIATLLPIAAIAAEDETRWNKVLKPEFFAQQTLEESDKVITLEAPVRAEDPSLVPIKVSSKIKQSQDRYIKKISVFVDNNPYPYVGEFEFTPESGKADIAMRIRVNTNSYIRAIAQMNDGTSTMTKTFVKASGGCSAPVGANLDEAMTRLGKMKFKMEGDVKVGEPNSVQLMISHPNVTGMQMDQVTRFVKKSHFVKQVKVSFNDKAILTAKTDIAISSDPNFRFYFVPEKAGTLTAEVTDTSCETPTDRSVCTGGNTYTETFKIQP